MHKPIWTATEAMTWLAFGKPETWDQVIRRYLQFRARWRVDPPATEVELLLLCRSQPAPFYPYLPVILQGRIAGWENPFASPSRWIEGPNGRARIGAPDLARAIRSDHRRRSGSLINYAELAALIRAELDEHDARRGKLDIAMNRLRDGILREELTAWAVRGSDPRQEHVALPVQVAFRKIQFRHDCIEPDEDAPCDEFRAILNGERWLQVRFRSADVVALIAPQPFPAVREISPWTAVAWRAFHSLDVPTHITQHRSFDGGTSRLPDESQTKYAERLEEHRQFDAAEREVLDLLACGRVTATGRAPALAVSGTRLHEPVPGGHSAVPSTTFLDQQLAFTCGDELIPRFPTLSRLFPPYEVRGSDADPSFPLYFDVLIEAAALRDLWSTGPNGGAEPPLTPPIPLGRNKRLQGFDYAVEDAPLVTRAIEGIARKTYKNATDAARALANEAEGHGNAESKMKRLLKQITAIQSRSAAERDRKD